MNATAGVGHGIAAGNARWTFTGAAAGFDRHVAASVPGYADVHRLAVDLSDWFTGSGVVYDLGCATGALLAALGERHADTAARLVGIDAEAGMVASARRRCAHLPNVEIRRGDVTACELADADMVTGLYTVQFLPPGHRARLVRRIHAALRPGGALLLAEKTLAPTARLQDIAAGLYVEHKLRAGFTAAQITTKARSLKHALVPLTAAANVAMLRGAGFAEVATVHKAVCFETFLAIKDG